MAGRVTARRRRSPPPAMAGRAAPGLRPARRRGRVADRRHAGEAEQPPCRAVRDLDGDVRGDEPIQQRGGALDRHADGAPAWAPTAAERRRGRRRQARRATCWAGRRPCRARQSSRAPDGAAVEGCRAPRRRSRRGKRTPMRNAPPARRPPSPAARSCSSRRLPPRRAHAGDDRGRGALGRRERRAQPGQFVIEPRRHRSTRSVSRGKLSRFAEPLRPIRAKCPRWIGSLWRYRPTFPAGLDWLSLARRTYPRIVARLRCRVWPMISSSGTPLR